MNSINLRIDRHDGLTRLCQCFVRLLNLSSEHRCNAASPTLSQADLGAVPCPGSKVRSGQIGQSVLVSKALLHVKGYDTLKIVSL